MSQKFLKLTRSNVRKLKPGQRLSEHGVDVDCLQNGDIRYRINIMVDGERIHRVIGRESEGVTLTQVESAVQTLKTHAREKRLKLPKGRKINLGFAEAANQYIEGLEQEGGKNISRKARQLELHLVPHFQNKPLVDISTFDVEVYKKLRKDKNIKPGTINREVAVLSHLLNKAVEWKWLEHKPCQTKLLKEDNARINYLTIEQCDDLLTAAANDNNPQIYMFVLIGLETAMRRSEILSIQIENIKPEQLTLFIPKAKAGARVQPITPRLAQYLANHITVTGQKTGWLFPSIGNKPSALGYTTCMEEPFRRVVKAAGLNPKEVTIHTMRHTATTHLVQSGIDLPTVQCITGHKTPAMVYRYSHRNGAHIQQAMEKLEQRYNAGRKVASITPKLHQPDKTASSVKAEKPSEKEISAQIKNYPQGNSKRSSDEPFLF